MAEMPDDLDEDRAVEMILRGEALPAEWLPWIRDLEMDGTAIADLAPLAGLDHLCSLDLHGTQVKNLGPLAGLWRLEELDLGKTQVTDLGPLANLPNLRWLDLQETPVSDLRPLAGLRRLKDLELRQTQVVDLAPLAGLADLRGLDLGGTRVGDVKAVAELRRLEELDLKDTRVVDLTPLAGLANLQWLGLDDTRVTDLKPLAGLRKLRKVDLRRTRVADLTPIAHVASVVTTEDAQASRASEPAPVPPRPQAAARWLWRLAAWACGLAAAAIVARALMVVASGEPATEGARRVKELQVFLCFAALPFMAAMMVPPLCAARWGRRGAWTGARAVIGLFLAVYAMFVVALANSGVGGQLIGFAAFSLVVTWLGIITFALIAALSAATAWPNGRPVRPYVRPDK